MPNSHCNQLLKTLFLIFIPLAFLIFTAPVNAQSNQFSIIWQVNLGSWAEHPIIKDGVVYVPSTNGKLTAIQLSSGTVLKSISGVNDATAPFIIGNKIYSLSPRGMHEIDLSTFQQSRLISLPNGWYSENVPYDNETGYFFVREGQEGQYKGRVSAINVSSGQTTWSYPQNFEGGFDGHQNPIVVGDSVFFQSVNSFWKGSSSFFRVNKKTGQLIWSTTLSEPSRGGYNNPIYDQEHDMIYVSESWNSMNSRVYAIRRNDGSIAWKKDISGGAIESTLTYYDNTIYLPLHNFSGAGSYIAISANNGATIWHEPGFFNEDGWSANGVDDKYLYRLAHGARYIIVQDRLTGKLVWSKEVDASAPCFNPVMSNGIVLVGSESSIYAIKAGTGNAVNSDFHGKDATGFNPGAINWGIVPSTFPSLPPSTSPRVSPSPVSTPQRCQPLGDMSTFPNCKGTVTALDLAYFLSKFDTTDFKANLDNTGKVNALDLSILLKSLGS